MNTDIVLGGVIGLVQGFLMQPILNFLFRAVVEKVLVKISRSPAFCGIFGAAFAAVGVGAFLVMVILAKDFVVSWDQFKAGWVVGFFVGALACTLSRAAS